MKTITSAKENMALLSQEQLSQAAFATLCQAFALRLLERAGYEDGLYQQAALDFLEEGQESPPPVENVFNIDLSIVLESLRKEEKERRQEKQAAEKLLTQVLQLQEQVSAQTRGEKAGAEQRFLTVQLYPATLWQQTVYAERLLHGGNSEDAAAPLTALGGRQGQRLTAVPSRNGENAGNRSQAANVQLPVQAIMAWQRSHPNGAESAAPGRPGRRMTWRSALSEQDAPPPGKDWAAEVSAARPLAVQPEPTGRQTGRYGLPPEPLTYRTEQEKEGQSVAPSADRQLAQTVSDAVNRVLQRHLEDARPSRPAREVAQTPTGQTRTPTAGQQRDRRPETASSPEHTGGQTAARPEPPAPPAPARAAGERQKQREKQDRQSRTNRVTEEAGTPSFTGPPSQRETAPVWRESKPEALREESRDAARLTAANAAPEGAGTAEHPSTSAAALVPEMRTAGTVPPQKSGTPWRETDTPEEDASAASWHRSGQRVLPRRDSLGTVAVQPDQPSGQPPAEWLPLEPLELAQLDESAVHEEGAARLGSRENSTTSQRREQPVGSAAGPKGQDADERTTTPRGNSSDQAPSPARERAAAPERPSLGASSPGLATVSRDVRMAGGDSLGNTQGSAQPLRQEGHSEEALTNSASEGQTRQQTTAGEAQQNRQPQPPTPELHHPKTAQTAA
ncbi:MAG: hypothetical protein LUC35_07920, partial [Clostridiales bacterium]|nr:hypothetical protein [Clostridiales bacterium]